MPRTRARPLRPTGSRSRAPTSASRGRAYRLLCAAYAHVQICVPRDSVPRATSSERARVRRPPLVAAAYHGTSHDVAAFLERRTCRFDTHSRALASTAQRKIIEKSVSVTSQTQISPHARREPQHDEQVYKFMFARRRGSERMAPRPMRRDQNGRLRLHGVQAEAIRHPRQVGRRSPTGQDQALSPRYLELEPRCRRQAPPSARIKSTIRRTSARRRPRDRAALHVGAVLARPLQRLEVRPRRARTSPRSKGSHPRGAFNSFRSAACSTHEGIARAREFRRARVSTSADYHDR